jgi:hypothetical protein
MKRLLLTVPFLVVAPAALADEVTVLSAPILPQVMVLYASEGASFPTTPEAAEALVDASALSFDDLANACAALDGLYDIVPEPSTPDEIARNYDEIARCSYDQYTSKPYWIPALVDEVDICARTLGDEWHLLSEAEVTAFTEDELTFIQTTLASVNEGAGWGNFYFSMRAWVRATDGSIAQADLTPGLTTPRVTPLPVAASDSAWTSHYEGGLGLRCVRTETVEPE